MLYDRLSVPHPEQLRLFRWAGDKNVAVASMWGEWDNTPSGIVSSSFSYPESGLRSEPNRARCWRWCCAKPRGFRRRDCGRPGSSPVADAPGKVYALWTPSPPILPASREGRQLDSCATRCRRAAHGRAPARMMQQTTLSEKATPEGMAFSPGFINQQAGALA